MDINKKTIDEVCGYILRDMTNKNGGFYSAEDADSEGEEGKFYIWNEDELKLYIREDFEIFKDYYNVNKQGLW